MAWIRLEGDWERWKSALRRQWERLSEADLDAIAGNRDRLAGKLLERYGYGKQRAEQEVDAFLRTLDET